MEMLSTSFSYNIKIYSHCSENSAALPFNVEPQVEKQFDEQAVSTLKGEAGTKAPMEVPIVVVYRSD